jgi:SHAQKYF class myb-like DNA-binding protein
MSSPTGNGNDDFMPGYDDFEEANLHPHTQFLDLTNGEGGERPEDEETEHYEEHEDEDDEEEEGDEEDDGGGMLDSFMAATTTHASGVMDNRTSGKVVETGHEHTGRWTKEEHESFLSALQTYGKEWKKVAAKVKTRTVVQTRTHAQKYFQKLQKATEGGSSVSVDAVDMGVSLEAKKASSQKKKKPRGLASIASASKQNRRGSSATLSAAQVISGLSSSQPSGIASYVSTVSNASPQQQQQQQQQQQLYQQQPMATVAELPTQPPRHGFSTSEATFAPAYPSAFGSGVLSSADSWMRHAGVKIVAPDPQAAMSRGNFPEPSPAATGKRKLAEIAAARMLAGVAGVARITEDRDGAPTPPPMPEYSSGGLNMKNAPAPPMLFGGGDAGGFASARKGLSLQIVNPASLGINYEEQQRRKRAGGDSPVTPWDGQLEALVSEKRAKSEEFKFDNDEKSSGHSDNGYGANVALHPVCGLGTNIERTRLHQAICDVDVVSLKNHLGVLANLSDGVLQRQDENGYCPLHTACAMTMAYPEKAAQVGEMVRMLLGVGADPTREDNHGNTALHWASRSGDRHVTELLLLKNCPQDAKNSRGETALHWGMRAGAQGMEVVSVLLENGARPGVLNLEFRRPIDIAGEGFLDDPGSLATVKAKDSKQQRKTMSREYKKALKDTALSRRDARANLLIRSAQSRTLVLHHPECLDHIPKSSSDWEAPDRITSIMRRVFPSSDPTGATETSGIFPHEVTVSKEFERAKLDLLSRIHSTEYLSFVNELSKDLEKQHKDAGGSLEESEHGFGPPPVVPFTPMVQRSMIKIAENRVKLGANSDTAFSAGSLRAARRATGAVQHAVDW